MTYVTAWQKGPQIIAYIDENGSESIREGGSRAWRNFNPGNISKGTFADSCGAIGGDSRFAVFPDEQTGLDAIISLFKSRTYRLLTLKQAIYRYAPPIENDSAAYVAAIISKTGVESSAVVQTLSETQFQALSKAVQDHEGWQKGKEYSAGQRGKRPELFVEALDATFVALSDSKVKKLVALGEDAKSVQQTLDMAAKSMKRAGLGYTLHNACAATLSAFLQQAGFEIPTILGAGKLAAKLKATGWTVVAVGSQQSGDVGVCYDKTPPAGADHIYLVVERINADQMLIADNQAPKKHVRFASGHGKTGTEYFLRAPGPISLFADLVVETDEKIDPDNNDFFPWDDEDTNGLPDLP